jgi:putative toxin-antitoxin system antitoxin component (TIGR02293 family)
MVNEFQAVIAELGGESTLRRRVRTDVDLHAAIRAGFPPPVVQKVMRAGQFTLKELARSLDVSPRSLQRRRYTGRLASHESERLYRLARIMMLARRYIGDADTASKWLKELNRALGGAIPLELVDTELGSRSVERVLGRIAYGGIG